MVRILYADNFINKHPDADIRFSLVTTVLIVDILPFRYGKNQGHKFMPLVKVTTSDASPDKEV